VTERNCIVASYRFFGIDERNLVIWEECLGCFDDAEALAAATTRSVAGVGVEVWDVARFVGRCSVH
jgi:hypothetical protein